MARTSRKKGHVSSSDTLPAASNNQIIYNVGGYIRLSVEDSGKDSSDTIENQKDMITQFVSQNPAFQLCELYCDNGKTGTNFNRPGFQKMMTDIKAGKINCILVKDLSRFRRNYIETGAYLEQIFPFLGVRFISISDNFDSNSLNNDKSSLLIPLKNMINEAYSKDISKKLYAVFGQQQKEGKIIGRWAAYGYQKCVDDPHKIMIDEETAPTVKRIFQWRVEGKSLLWIARMLNELGIPSPQHYHYLKGDLTKQGYQQSLWRSTAVQTICSNLIYTGNMVQHKSIRRSGILKRVPKSEWIIVPGTHEPIVSQELFDLAQQTTKSNKCERNRSGTALEECGEKENLLKGLIFCSNCGARMVRNRCVIRDKLYVKYVCSNHRENPQNCPNKTTREGDILDILRETIQNQIKLAVDVNRIISENNLYPNQEQSRVIQSRIDDIKQRRANVQLEYENLYAAYIEGHLTLDKYLQVKSEITAAISKIQQELDEREKERSALHCISKDSSSLELFHHFRNQESLSYEMIHELIERIEVSDKGEIKVKFRCCNDIRCLEDFTSCMNEVGNI